MGDARPVPILPVIRIHSAYYAEHESCHVLTAKAEHPRAIHQSVSVRPNAYEIRRLEIIVPQCPANHFFPGCVATRQMRDAVKVSGKAGGSLPSNCYFLKGSGYFLNGSGEEEGSEPEAG